MFDDYIEFVMMFDELVCGFKFFVLVEYCGLCIGMVSKVFLCICILNIDISINCIFVLV